MGAAARWAPRPDGRRGPMGAGTMDGRPMDGRPDGRCGPIGPEAPWTREARWAPRPDGRRHHGREAHGPEAPLTGGARPAPWPPRCRELLSSLWRGARTCTRTGLRPSPGQGSTLGG